MQKSADEEEFVCVLHIAHHDVQFGTQSSSHGQDLYVQAKDGKTFHARDSERLLWFLTEIELRVYYEVSEPNRRVFYNIETQLQEASSNLTVQKADRQE